jgi:hypothetical protein
MGQYYKPININKKEWLYSHDYNNGLKLMEHSYIGNNFVNAVENLLIEGGSWFKNKIVWAGDYADEEPTSEWTNLKDEYPNKCLYSIIGIEKNEIKPKNTKKIDKKYRYLCNFDRKEYVDYEAVKEIEKDWKINPLPLLTAEGNGRGGGDFHEDGIGSVFVGTWARNKIGIMVEIPKGFTELDPNFKE